MLREELMTLIDDGLASAGLASSIGEIADVIERDLLPVHERQVREQVAEAIEGTVCAPPEGHTRPCPDCYRYYQMQRDARIAREGL